jgi:cytochrome P450
MTDAQHDPIAQLESEHQAMRQLFAQWRALTGGKVPDAQRKALAEEICTQLSIHARLEDELLYPLAREAIREHGLLDSAEKEHAHARELMCRVLQMRGHDERFDPTVDRLCEQVERHMLQESVMLFPRLRRCGADLALLGHRLRERRRELEAVSEALREEALVSTTA